VAVTCQPALQPAPSGLGMKVDRSAILATRSGTATLDTCSHLWPDSEERTRAAIDSVADGDEAAVSDIQIGP